VQTPTVVVGGTAAVGLDGAPAAGAGVCCWPLAKKDGAGAGAAGWGKLATAGPKMHEYGGQAPLGCMGIIGRPSAVLTVIAAGVMFVGIVKVLIEICSGAMIVFLLFLNNKSQRIKDKTE
jgi:hypothetical protein